MVSLSTDNVRSNGISWMGKISGDGKFAVFVSVGDNLVENDINNSRDHEYLTDELPIKIAELNFPKPTEEKLIKLISRHSGINLKTIATLVNDIEKEKEQKNQIETVRKVIQHFGYDNLIGTKAGIWKWNKAVCGKLLTKK